MTNTDIEKTERYSNNWYALCLAIIKKTSCNNALSQMGIKLYETKEKKRKNWKKIFTPEALKIAKENGLNKNTLMQRLLLGWNINEAISTPKLQKGTKTHNKKYPDWVYEKLKENNIKLSVFSNRVKQGWDLNKACTTPLCKRGRKSKKLATNKK